MDATPLSRATPMPAPYGAAGLRRLARVAVAAWAARACVLAVLSLWGLWLPAAWAQPAPALVKPFVLINFDIVSPAFRDTLPQRDAARAAIGAVLAEELRRRYGVIDWLVQPPPGAQPVGTFTARLAERAGESNPVVEVQWWGSFGPQGSTQPLNLPPTEIYPTSESNWATNNRARFESTVVGKMLVQLRLDSFQAALLEVFIKRLPLATAVDVAAADRTVVLPLAWAQAGMDVRSELRVDFSRQTGESRERGTLMLDNISEHPRGPLRQRVQGGVRAATFQSQPLPLQDRWNPDLQRLLNGAQVSCFIEHYEPLRNSINGVVLP